MSNTTLKLPYFFAFSDFLKIIFPLKWVNIPYVKGLMSYEIDCLLSMLRFSSVWSYLYKPLGCVCWPLRSWVWTHCDCETISRYTLSRQQLGCVKPSVTTHAPVDSYIIKSQIYSIHYFNPCIIFTLITLNVRRQILNEAKFKTFGYHTSCRDHTCKFDIWWYF